MSIYNETNFTALFQNVPLTFNQTAEAGISLVNGTGTWKAGYMSSYCRVEGFDLLLQMEILQSVLMIIILLLVTFYVTIYTWRMITYE